MNINEYIHIVWFDHHSCSLLTLIAGNINAQNKAGAGKQNLMNLDIRVTDETGAAVVQGDSRPG